MDPFLVHVIGRFRGSVWESLGARWCSTCQMVFTCRMRTLRCIWCFRGFPPLLAAPFRVRPSSPSAVRPHNLQYINTPLFTLLYFASEGNNIWLWPTNTVNIQSRALSRIPCRVRPPSACCEKGGGIGRKASKCMCTHETKAAPPPTK